MENVTLHLMFGLITPFVIYLIAERFHVSGILAVAAAGIAHSFNRDKFSPENANFNIASDSIWSMLAFTLEGLVFVIMGTQLPKILASVQEQIYSITALKIGIYILLITLLLMLLRFIWSVTTIKKKVYNDVKHPVSKIRAGIIISLSGTRGAITLASVMSIPLLLSSGIAFPQRDLIILIAAGVIVVSMLLTSFILPLCIEKKEKTDKPQEYQAYIEILQNVIKELKTNTAPEDEAIIASIIANYYNRISKLQRKQNSRRVDRKEERDLRITIYEWEKKNIAKLLNSGDTDEQAAQFYLSILDNQIEKLIKNRFDFRRIILHFFHQSHKIVNPKERAGLRSKIFDLMEINTRFVLEKLRDMSHTYDSSAIRKVMENYELRQYMYQRGLQYSKHNKEHFIAVLTHSFQIERDNIQAMFELGRISRDTVREMRHNISLLEIQLKKEYF
jgi:CPA1 family monovalent cation:H+ antiporter